MDIGYLSTFGLQRANALDYFYTSPFFDTSSNNQRVRSQGVALDQHVSILQTMTGVEYILDEVNTCEPNLFVFRKQRRRSPKAADLLDIFYCTDGIIYKAPDFLHLLKTRIAKATYYLDKSFETVRAGTRWADETAAAAGGEDNDAEAALGSKRRRKSGFVCWNAAAPAPAEDGHGGMDVERGTEGLSLCDSDPFFAKRRQRAASQRGSERVIRDFPTFKGVLQDVRL